MSSETRTAAGHPLAVILATLLGQTQVSMGLMTLPAIAPTYARAFGAEPTLIGFQVSLAYLAAMAATAFSSGIIRRWGACRGTQAALLFTSLGALMAMKPSLWALVPASILLGFGYGLTNPAAAHLLVRFTGDGRQNLIFSVKQTGVPLGGMAAALVAPALALTVGWPYALAAVALFGVLLIILLQPFRRGWDNDRSAAGGMGGLLVNGVGLVWRDRKLRPFAVAAFFFAAVQLTLTTFTVTLLVRELGYGPLEAGLTLSLMQAAGLVGRLFFGWLSDRTGRSDRVLFGLGLLLLVGCVGVTFLSGGWSKNGVMLLFLLLGSTALGWNGVFLAQAARTAKKSDVGAATGGALIFNFTGVLLGPSIYAALHGVLGSYLVAFWAPTLFCLFAVAALALGMGGKTADNRRASAPPRHTTSL